MLSLLRKHSGSWIIKIILGAIVVVFVLWGVGNFRRERGVRVATVNGEPITVESYQKAYNNLMEQVNQNNKKGIKDELKEIFKNQALENLIKQNLLLQRAKILNIRVSDEELSWVIKKIPAFQTNGNFDTVRYQKILTQLRMIPEQFESEQRDAMLIDKLHGTVTSNINVSDEEAREWFEWNNALVNIEYILFDPTQYKDINISEKEIIDFFGSHKEDYKTEPMVKVRYLYFDPKLYEAKVAITDDMVKDYYEKNKQEFLIPKTVEFRQIELKVDSDASNSSLEEVRKKALDIIDKAKGGQDFSELIKAYSESPDKEQNEGRLGPFKKEEMIKPFSDKLFSMNIGEISEPIRTQLGWHVLRLDRINQEILPPQKEVEPQIKKQIMEEKARGLSRDDAEAVYDVCFEGDDLVKVAKGRNLEVNTTDFFTVQGPETKIKDRAKFASVAFTLDIMQISEVQDLGDGYYIIQMFEKQSPKIPEFKDVKENVKKDLLRKFQDEKAQKSCEEFITALKQSKSISEESKKRGYVLENTGFFKRDSEIPKIGYDPKFSEVVFHLSKNNPYPDNSIKGNKGYYAISFLERRIPQEEEFLKDKDKIKKMILEQKKRSSFEAWLTNLREKSEVTIRKDLM
ncbi:MAG: SurA N-terminal domain-containing protein [Desulfobacterales bacterium]|nr:SurA N-terminal domain-containing protein [Desulfobacterales bacterium]